MEFIIAAIAFVGMPLVLWLIDVFVGINSLGRKYEFNDTHHHDFTVIVPIYGQIKYLENVEYLSQYSNQVMLLTTGGESKEFMSEIRSIAKKHKFNVFVADWSGKQDLSKRATSGTIRDRLIRDALHQVKTEYVVPLDADSVSIENISIAVGELVSEGGDIASVKLVPTNGDSSWLTKLQKLEYRISMEMRKVVPWLISGACQISKTDVMIDVMDRHSLFFQGNDVEIGLLAEDLGYNVVHIPFEVHTALPAGIKPWFRQRLAWAGGEFRLFIINFKYALRHPFFWAYGAILVIAALPLRYLALSRPSIILAIVLGLHAALVYAIHLKYRNSWLLIMPFYTLFSSIVLVPLGFYMYFYMAFKDKNMGIINKNITAKKSCI